MKVYFQSPVVQQSLKQISRRLFLTIVFILSLLRLSHFLTDFFINGLQIDFSAFYTAGEALNYGLSPYDNNLEHSPPVWDGINIYHHSRFLYPPLVANLFQPIALIPYFYAKIIWGVFALLCIMLASYITSKLLVIERPNQVLLFGISVCWYYPLLTHLERGQIDAVTLLLLTSSLYFMGGKNKIQERISGIFVAAAVLLKLHSIYILPFLIARKRWRAFEGFAMATSVIIVASLATSAGRTLLKHYLIHEMPRIANYGRSDHGDNLLNDKVIQTMIKDLPNGYTTKDSHIYQPVSFNFVGNATLIRPIYNWLNSYGVNFNFAVLSFVVFSIFFLLLLVWQYHFFPTEDSSPEKEFLYWQAIFTVILLSAPITHVMNTVWLLPVFLVVIEGYSKLNKVSKKLAYGTMLSGLILIGMSDTLYFDLLSLFPLQLMDHKYLIGEALVLIGSLFYLSERTSPGFLRYRLVSQRIPKKQPVEIDGLYNLLEPKNRQIKRFFPRCFYKSFQKCHP
jgi:hypothetical protein